MIKINLSQLQLVEEISTYNNNYYKHKESNTDTLIFVHTDEQFNTEDVYVVSGNIKIFLGSCDNFDASDLLELKLGLKYT